MTAAQVSSAEGENSIDSRIKQVRILIDKKKRTETRQKLNNRKYENINK